MPAGDRLYGIGAHLWDGTDPAERIRAMRDADEARWVERRVEVDAEIRAAYAVSHDERGRRSTSSASGIVASRWM